MLRLNQNSLNTKEESPFVKMSVNMKDVNLTDSNFLLDKMKINLHMLGTVMLNRVDREVHDADIIAVDEGAPRRQGLELMEQLTQSGGLSHAIDNSTILGLSAGAGDDGLWLGQPGNQVVPQEHRIA
jgi:hypothetical protein